MEYFFWLKTAAAYTIYGNSKTVSHFMFIKVNNPVIWYLLGQVFFRSRSSCLQILYKLRVLKNFAIFTGKGLYWKILVIKRRLQHRCSSGNMAKVLRTPTPFLQNTSRWLLLHGMVKLEHLFSVELFIPFPKGLLTEINPIFNPNQNGGTWGYKSQLPTSIFSPVTSENVGSSQQILLIFNFNTFATLV